MENTQKTPPRFPLYAKGDIVRVSFPHDAGFCEVEIVSDPIPCYYGQNTGGNEGKWCDWTYNMRDGYFFEIWVAGNPNGLYPNEQKN